MLPKCCHALAQVSLFPRVCHRPFYDDKKGIFKVLRPKNALRLIVRGERKIFRLYVAKFAANLPGLAFGGIFSV